MIHDGQFRKAIGSESKDCVEVAALPEGGVQVRNSRDTTGPVLAFTDDEWRAFISGAAKGEFTL